MRGVQPSNVVARQAVARPRLPDDRADAIEAEQSGFRTDPEIAIGRLCDGEGNAPREPVADLPRGVRVLADVERRVERIGTRPAREEHADGENRAWRRPIHASPSHSHALKGELHAELDDSWVRRRGDRSEAG